MLSSALGVAQVAVRAHLGSDEHIAMCNTVTFSLPLKAQNIMSATTTVLVLHFILASVEVCVLLGPELRCSCYAVYLPP